MRLDGVLVLRLQQLGVRSVLLAQAQTWQHAEGQDRLGVSPALGSDSMFLRSFDLLRRLVTFKVAL